MRQTSLGGWYKDKNNNIEPLHKDSLQLLTMEFASIDIDESALKHIDAISHIKKRGERVLEANGNLTPSLSPSQRLGAGAWDIISFEHVNINGINTHDNFVELSNAIDILATMEAGVYSTVGYSMLEIL